MADFLYQGISDGLADEYDDQDDDGCDQGHVVLESVVASGDGQVTQAASADGSSHCCQTDQVDDRYG